MAVKRKKNEAKPIHTQIVDGITKAVSELYTHHSGEIQENLDESENKKIAVTFAAELDLSESEPLVTVKIRFSSSVTDKRSFRVDDQNQIQLFESKKDLEASEAGEEQTENAAAGEAEKETE